LKGKMILDKMIKKLYDDWFDYKTYKYGANKNHHHAVRTLARSKRHIQVHPLSYRQQHAGLVGRSVRLTESQQRKLHRQQADGNGQQDAVGAIPSRRFSHWSLPQITYIARCDIFDRKTSAATGQRAGSLAGSASRRRG
jgi:hypothetical protein